MSVFICGVCGHIEFGGAFTNCPVCQVPLDKFKQNDNVFIESEEKSKEASVKHIPAITINKQCGFIPEAPCWDVMVRIGKVLHPMEEKHHIVFIDCYVDGKHSTRINLTPDVYAAGCFHLKAGGRKVSIVEFCNIHGYWMADASLE